LCRWWCGIIKWPRDALLSTQRLICWLPFDELYKICFEYMMMTTMSNQRTVVRQRFITGDRTNRKNGRHHLYLSSSSFGILLLTVVFMVGIFPAFFANALSVKPNHNKGNRIPHWNELGRKQQQQQKDQQSWTVEGGIPTREQKHQSNNIFAVS